MAETITTDTFDTEVLGSESPVLVDFWAEWCGPCHAVAPVLDQIAEERSELRLVKVNIDEEPELATRYDVLAIPTVMLFADGEPRGTVHGARAQAHFERWLAEVLPAGELDGVAVQGQRDA